MRGLSASECAGLPLSTSIARYRAGWSVRISSAMTLHGTSPEMIRAPATGLVREEPLPLKPDPARLTMLDGTYCPPGIAKLPGEQPDAASRGS